MNAVRERSWLPAKLLLLAMLVTAQSGALAHAFKHDAATPQNPTCATCVTVSQLGASCVDSPAVADLAIVHARPVEPGRVIAVSRCVPVPKQRGPPVSL